MVTVSLGQSVAEPEPLAEVLVLDLSPLLPQPVSTTAMVMTRARVRANAFLMFLSPFLSPIFSLEHAQVQERQTSLSL